MLSRTISECLSNRTGSYLIPLLWYTGESAELVRKEMDAIRQAGISEFIFENRGGWFCTEPWMRLFEEILQYAAECRMRVWLLDDSHVNTGSANDSLKRPENAPFRQQCLRNSIRIIKGMHQSFCLLYNCLHNLLITVSGGVYSDTCIKIQVRLSLFIVDKLLLCSFCKKIKSLISFNHIFACLILYILYGQPSVC